MYLNFSRGLGAAAADGDKRTLKIEEYKQFCVFQGKYGIHHLLVYYGP